MCVFVSFLCHESILKVLKEKCYDYQALNFAFCFVF